MEQSVVCGWHARRLRCHHGEQSTQLVRPAVEGLGLGVVAAPLEAVAHVLPLTQPGRRGRQGVGRHSG